MGKNKYIESPEKMWELFVAYKKSIKDSPKLKTVFGGKDFGSRQQDLERPLTMVGFENYVADIDGMPISLDQYFSNQDDLYRDYMGICSRIRREIRQDQIEGGMCNIYNPSITQRLNGLADKQEVTRTKIKATNKRPKDGG